MSGSFAGFSEEDIKNLNNKNSYQARKTAEGKKTRLQPKKPNQQTAKPTLPMNQKILNEKIKNSNIEPIPESAKLQVNIIDDTNQKHIVETEENKLDINNEVKEVLGSHSSNTNENVHEFSMSERKLNLAQFQERQKLIEEQNKKRKELLAKALAVRTKQTKEETQKLESIREEFKKLDILLSADVKILRQQIEIASVEYMEAEKRYFRIEKEFLNAKLLLHQKAERKEMLTEHLCAVIEKNEERKAEKLDELMNKLNLKIDLHNEVTIHSYTNKESNVLKD